MAAESTLGVRKFNSDICDKRNWKAVLQLYAVLQKLVEVEYSLVNVLLVKSYDFAAPTSTSSWSTGTMGQGRGVPQARVEHGYAATPLSA